MYRNIVRGAIEMMMRISRHGKTIERISKRRRSLAGRRLNITFGAVTQTAFSSAAEAPMPRTIWAAICFRKWDTQMLRAPVCCVAHLLPRTCFRVIAINFVPDSINLSADLSSSRFRPGLERKTLVGHLPSDRNSLKSEKPSSKRFIIFALMDIKRSHRRRVNAVPENEKRITTTAIQPPPCDLWLRFRVNICFRLCLPSTFLWEIELASLRWDCVWWAQRINELTQIS